MKQPIPSYLLALAVGNIEYRATGPRTGVYSEPEMVEKAKWELCDLEKMVQAAEKINGPVPLGSVRRARAAAEFPAGRDGNPRLTFARR
jgi:aminopeptidase N